MGETAKGWWTPTTPAERAQADQMRAQLTSDVKQYWGKYPADWQSMADCLVMLMSHPTEGRLREVERAGNAAGWSARTIATAVHLYCQATAMVEQDGMREFELMADDGYAVVGYLAMLRIHEQAVCRHIRALAVDLQSRLTVRDTAAALLGASAVLAGFGFDGESVQSWGSGA